MSMRLFIALTFALSQTGCYFLFDDNNRGETWDPPPQAPPRPRPPPNPPPRVDSIEIADWPPIGPKGRVHVQASDDTSVSSVQFRFRNSVTRAISGSLVTASVTGRELGEGFGELVVRALDSNGGFAERHVTDLLVDLSPPIVEVGRTVIRASGEGAWLELWVADAWVLGNIELEFGSKTLVHGFESGYPSTLGKDWDQSIVRFEATELPAGRGPALLRVSDAAGNVLDHSFDLNIDALAPELRLVRPAPGTHVAGPFEVELEAADPGGGPVWVELYAGGAPLARAAGSSQVLLDAAELAPGPVELRAVGYDEAGNTTTVSIELTVDPSP